jgi:hypothetical protein
MRADPALLLRLDEKIRLDLHAGRDGFFVGLLISTGIVLLGVLLEGPEIVREISDPGRQSVYGWLSILEDRLAKSLSLVGWFVLILGLVGEAVFEGLVSKADGQVQTFDDIVVSDAIRNAGAAVQQAANAEVRAAKILAEIQPRELSEAQAEEIGHRLERFAGMEVSLESYQFDVEGRRFADLLITAIEKAGIKCRNHVGLFPAGTFIAAGVVVLNPSEVATASQGNIKTSALSARERLLADAIKSALNSQGIKLSREGLGSSFEFPGVLTRDGGTVTLVVGVKPSSALK